MSTTAQSVVGRPEYLLARLLDHTAQWLRRAGNAAAARVVAVIALCSFTSILRLRIFSVTDPDIWWHMATARWILQNHALPHTDPFSTFGAGKPWIAYSWGFDFATYGLFQAFGPAGIVVYEIAARILFSWLLFRLIRSLTPHFWRAAGVTALALFAMDIVVSPRPGMATILFTILELHVLLEYRRTGNPRRLWLIPLFLAVWCNWHIQFVYGLIVLAAFAAEPLANRIFFGAAADVSPARTKPLWITLGAGGLATFLNPAGPRLYSTVWIYMHQPKVYSVVDELMAMNFRQPQHYVVTLLALGAGIAIGWRRERRLLWPLLLAFAAVVNFRSVKEIWFLAVISACAISDGWVPWHAAPRPLFQFRERALVVLGIIAAVMVGWRHYDVTNAWLEMQIAGSFPVAATQYIEKHNLQGPLYNDFNWGGYLIWRLPGTLVSIDGRTNVHDDERVWHYSRVWRGYADWATDTELPHAGYILTGRKSPLTSILLVDAQYKVLYQDSQAVIFQPR